LDNVLRACGPHAVAIPGWSTRGALSALRWCRTTGVPAIVMSDSWDPDGGRKWWTETIKRQIIPLYASALVGGTPQRDYLERLGMPRERIFTSYDAVDNDHFADGAVDARRSASTLRQQLKLPRHYFLSTCRFISEKNLHRLLVAYAAYRSVKQWNAWHLVLVGDGSLKDELVRLQHQLGLQTSVHFVGFQQYEQLPVYYGLAEAFILPSVSETWGLVVNEAMAAGLPVLVSNFCGCAFDLVSEGQNGLSFDPRDVGAIRDAMVYLSGNQCD
jgi:glycosyltransferase involved in cell wall biosynthesis